jgi:hypothetical protein
MQIHQHTVLIQGISAIFIDQLPTCLVFRKAHSILASEFSTVYQSLTNLKNEKAQFQVALRRYLNAHAFYSADDFFMYTNDL